MGFICQSVEQNYPVKKYQKSPNHLHPVELGPDLGIHSSSADENDYIMSPTPPGGANGTPGGSNSEV